MVREGGTKDRRTEAVKESWDMFRQEFGARLHNRSQNYRSGPIATSISNMLSILDQKPPESHAGTLPAQRDQILAR
jgi:hypothetical protein